MLLTLALPFGCVGCSTGASASYEQISGAEAKALMDSESGYVIIDARTQEEYDQGHIPGAILIPEYEIADRAEKELPDKDQLILVYCRSGRRGKTPYPQYEFLCELRKCGFGAVITSDCHSKKYLDCYFDGAREYLASAGFRSKWVLTPSGFKEIEL